MKKICIPLIGFFALLVTFANAQENQAHTRLSFDHRLLAVYDADHLSTLQAENPFLIQRLNFYLDHAWYISPLPVEKITPDMPSVKIDDLDNINILVLEKEQHLTRDWEKLMIYRIENSDKALVFLSGKEFTEQLNKHLGRK
jgi:hypothetical protein